MGRKYNQKIVELFKDFFDKDDWKYGFDEENGYFHFSLNLPAKIKQVEYVVSVNVHDFNVYAISPLSADPKDPEQMKQISEYLCRVNYGLRCGNYEMDFDDGEIRYKTYLDCGDEVFPTGDMLDKCIKCPAAMFIKYGDGLLQILLNGKSAVEAIKLCE